MIKMFVHMTPNRIISVRDNGAFVVPDVVTPTSMEMIRNLEGISLAGSNTFELMGSNFDAILTRSTKRIRGKIIFNNIAEVLTFSKKEDIVVLGGASTFSSLFPFVEELTIVQGGSTKTGQSFGKLGNNFKVKSTDVFEDKSVFSGEDIKCTVTKLFWSKK